MPRAVYEKGDSEFRDTQLQPEARLFKPTKFIVRAGTLGNDFLTSFVFSTIKGGISGDRTGAVASRHFSMSLEERPLI